MPRTTVPAQPGRWWLYVVRCRDGTYYTGITNDLPRRLEQHDRGAASRYTRGRRPVELVHRAACRDRSSALKEERRVKSLSRRAKEALFRGTGGPAPAGG